MLFFLLLVCPLTNYEYDLVLRGRGLGTRQNCWLSESWKELMIMNSLARRDGLARKCCVRLQPSLRWMCVISVQVNCFKYGSFSGIINNMDGDDLEVDIFVHMPKYIIMVCRSGGKYKKQLCKSLTKANLQCKSSKIW